MASTSSKTKIPTWKFANPETFELTLRRLMEPSAEAKMTAALDKVIADIEASKHGPAAERREKAREEQNLKKKRDRLKRRLAKLQELKRMALGPLLVGLAIALFTWLIVLVLTGVGTVTVAQTIQDALAKDMETIAENSATGLTIEELDADIHVGQLMGMPGGEKDADGNYLKTGDEYMEPDYLLEITKWQPELDGCSATFALTDFDGELAGCEAAAVIDFTNQVTPEVTMSCLFLQLGDVNGPSKDTTESQQRKFGEQARFTNSAESVLKPNFWVLGPDNGWDEVTMLWCQTFGTDDEALANKMSFIAGQAGIRIDAKLYLAGGIFTWLEADGSYAPERVWEGHSREEY